MKREQIIRFFIVVVIIFGFGGAINVFGQSNEMHLPCLKKVYLASDSEVLLDCKPDESRYIAHKGFEWTIHRHVENKKVGEVLKGCIQKKGGKYYLLPSKIHKKVGSNQVVVAYKQFSDEGSELTLYYKIKVVAED